MIRSPLGLRLNPSAALSVKDQFREAATLGARGVVLDAAGELGPDRLSETGRRDLRHALRSVQLDLIAMHLPTRRPFDTLDQFEDRLARSDKAFLLAYELGARLVLARVGGVPPESDAPRREAFTQALRELARRAGHRGVRLAIETGSDPGSTVRAFLDALDEHDLAASLDPGGLLRMGRDPVAATRDLGPWVAHAYATDATGQARPATIANPRGFGFPAGALDWEEYVGALEEINYRGYLTIWPDPTRDVSAQVKTILDRLSRL